MKILTGRLHGQRLNFRPNPHLRPTADKARKAIFDMLQGQIQGKRVLDLFSGTGALGFEALSQGADHVTFVEKDKFQCREILGNLTRLQLTQQASVCCEQTLEALQRLSGSDKVFDFVFLDPPYDDKVAILSLEMIVRMKLVLPGGFVLVECRKREDLPEVFGNLKMLRDKRYGQTKILIYRCY